MEVDFLKDRSGFTEKSLNYQVNLFIHLKSVNLIMICIAENYIRLIWRNNHTLRKFIKFNQRIIWYNLIFLLQASVKF